MFCDTHQMGKHGNTSILFIQILLETQETFGWVCVLNTPYIQASSAPYSCWPIIVTPYNLPPELCMTKPYLFLTCLVPDPYSPKAKIDVYLQPLIDDLQHLWSDGVWTYDVSKK